jgi:[FeFe] hydrogenase H-cluster maturation GTPase HydF
MELNQTPRSVRVHIAFFGKSNAGKSSLINAVTGQQAAIVSEIKGTTTDPVYKSMEILPIGACELIDTAGLNDSGELGELRISKSLEVLNKTDIAIYVADATAEIDEQDEQIIEKIKAKKIPIIIALNKIDIATVSVDGLEHRFGVKVIPVSATTKQGIEKLKAALAESVPNSENKFKIVGDLVEPGDIVVLVTPIDKAAPKGRLILPQQQVIRDVLESDAIGVITKEYELRQTFDILKKKPKLVVTDSQVFLKVAADTPRDVMLTSFSILFARFKGGLTELVKGAAAINKLQDGDKILVAEACTHHQQSDDIGRVKIPRWLRQMTGKSLDFEYASGSTYGGDITKYSLIIHCGACMINRTEMMHRIETAKEYKIPIVNYGILIACVQGILDRVLEPFPLAKLIWDESKELL